MKGGGKKKRKKGDDAVFLFELFGPNLLLGGTIQRRRERRKKGKAGRLISRHYPTSRREGWGRKGARCSEGESCRSSYLTMRKSSEREGGKEKKERQAPLPCGSL